MPRLLTSSFFNSRYYRAHGLKSQVVLLPNGMIGSVFVASMRHNDNGILNLSGLNEYLIRILPRMNSGPGPTWFPALWGDGIFHALETVLGRWKRSAGEMFFRLTKLMSSPRIHIEHLFGQEQILWEPLKRPQYFNLGKQGHFSKQQVVVIAFCYTCQKESKVAKYFKVATPTLAQYLLPLHPLSVLSPTKKNSYIGIDFDLILRNIVSTNVIKGIVNRGI